MKTKSIQTKFMILIISGIVSVMLFSGSIGIYTLITAMRNDSVKIINLTCSEKVQELNIVFENIEKSVGILAQYAIDKLDEADVFITDNMDLGGYTADIEELGHTIVSETEGAVAIYVRLNPQLFSHKDGFFTVFNYETGKYEKEELTDLSLYEENDIEHVGWYYLPVKTGHAVWISPYYNRNIDVQMISYVTPFYKDERLIGVAGIDIELRYITDIVDSISVYETGHAFLTDDDFNIVHSRHFEAGKSVRELSKQLACDKDSDIFSDETCYEFIHDREAKELVIKPLKNEMCLAVTVPVSEIEKVSNQLIWQIIVITIIITIIFVFITAFITGNIIRPLKELNATAKEIANGNLDISLTFKSKDEVGTLAESIQETARQLKLHMDYINNLAYTDKLTGVQNNTAYLKLVSDINDNIDDDNLKFVVFVIDINGLKYVNDKYGHSSGNALIVAASEIILKVFDYENVYRVGGDEFAVIMFDVDEAKSNKLTTEFRNIIEQSSSEPRVYAAIGYSVFTKGDGHFEDVFMRADENMYKDKELMKNIGKNSNVN